MYLFAFRTFGFIQKLHFVWNCKIFNLKSCVYWPVLTAALANKQVFNSVAMDERNPTYAEFDIFFESKKIAKKSRKALLISYPNLIEISRLICKIIASFDQC